MSTDNPNKSDSPSTPAAAITNTNKPPRELPKGALYDNILIDAVDKSNAHIAGKGQKTKLWKQVLQELNETAGNAIGEIKDPRTLEKRYLQLLEASKKLEKRINNGEVNEEDLAPMEADNYRMAINHLLEIQEQEKAAQVETNKKKDEEELIEKGKALRESCASRLVDGLAVAVGVTRKELEAQPHDVTVLLHSDDEDDDDIPPAFFTKKRVKSEDNKKADVGEMKIGSGVGRRGKNKPKVNDDLLEFLKSNNYRRYEIERKKTEMESKNLEMDQDKQKILLKQLEAQMESQKLQMEAQRQQHALEMAKFELESKKFGGNNNNNE